MDKAEVVGAVCELVKRLGCRVSSPDFIATQFYAPQWKIYGSTYYYQLPNHGKIVAIIDDASSVYRFNEQDGFTMHDVYAA